MAECVMILKPTILTHPNIPKPLHGINPRSIMGQEWWDEQRQLAYAKYDFHCIACGVAKHEAKKHKWLEAHEFYEINYNTGVVEILSIEPLCHYCHNFIHSGRMAMIIGKEKSEKEVKEILEHGFKILADNNLKCFKHTLTLAEELNAKTFGVKSYNIPKVNIEWKNWKLIFNNQEFKSKFKSFEDWEEFYAK